MNIEDYNILDLLPQRPPYIMADKLTHYDPVVTRTTFEVRPDNLYCRADGLMEEAGLIENIAQTCAARMGYKEKTEPQRDGNIKIGLVGMLKSMHIVRSPRTGETLTTTIAIRDEIFNILQIEAQVEVNDETIAVCEMKLYLTDKKAE